MYFGPFLLRQWYQGYIGQLFNVHNYLFIWLLALHTAITRGNNYTLICSLWYTSLHTSRNMPYHQIHLLFYGAACSQHSPLPSQCLSYSKDTCGDNIFTPISPAVIFHHHLVNSTLVSPEVPPLRTNPAFSTVNKVAGTPLWQSFPCSLVNLHWLFNPSSGINVMYISRDDSL